MSQRSIARLARAESEAAKARARLGTTLGEIQEKLSPANILDEATRELRERGLQAADQAMASLRSRPVLATLAVSGIGWLLSRRPGLALLFKLFLGRGATARPPEHSIGSRQQRARRPRKTAGSATAPEETA